jgi:adenosylcobinamide-GDP ribazoletransferase
MAMRYLTIVPIPGVRPSREGPGAAAAWFPVVGLAIGALLVLVDRVTTALFAPLLAALLTVTAWKLVTGGLHLDGVADCLDGLVGRDPAQRLAIMRDSRIGAFGAVGLILFLLIEVAAVSGIDPRARWRALLLAPVVGRAMSPVMARIFPATGSGHGAQFRADLGTAAPITASALALALALAVLGLMGAAAFVVAALVTTVVGAFMTRRLGGVNGDVHGAAVELAELSVLLVVAVASPAR